MANQTIDTFEPSTTNDSPIRKRVIRSIKWQFVGQFANQFWRLGTNLILTRLLLPEAFGITALIFSLLYALRMISDVGLRDSVIHNEAADTVDFLNTVWTVQIIRGFIIFFLLCLMTVPMIRFYDEPEFLWLIPIAGLGSIVNGFMSTSMLTAGRHIHAKWTVVTMFGGNIVGTISMIVLAFLTRNVVALVVGHIVNSAATVLLSYRFGDHKKHRLCWQKDAVKSVSTFGRWIVPSSVIAIFLQQGDKMILGRLINKTELGLYSIGVNLAALSVMVFERIASAVFQPVYAKLRNNPIEVARSKVRRLRLGILAALFPIVWSMVLGSRWIFEFLYRPEFHAAAKYCSIMAIGIALRISTEMGPIFQAHGKPQILFRITVIKAVSVGLCMYIGFHFQGAIGFVRGISMAPLIYYPFQAHAYHKMKMWQPEVDFLGIIPAVIAFCVI